MHEGNVTCVDISGDEEMAVAGLNDWNLRRWGGRSGPRFGESLRGHDDLVNCVGMNQDGAMTVFGSYERTMQSWDGRSRAPLGDPVCGHDSDVTHASEFLALTHIILSQRSTSAHLHGRLVLNVTTIRAARNHTHTERRW